MCIRKWYPLKEVLWDDDSCHPLGSVIRHKHWIWFTNFLTFFVSFFSSLCLYIFTHFHIYLQHRKRSNSSQFFCSFIFISFKTAHSSAILLFCFFMPSFSELIRVQSNPGIKRTPRFQKMAYYNLITISNRLHTRRSRVGVSKVQRRNEKQKKNKN